MKAGCGALNALGLSHKSIVLKRSDDFAPLKRGVIELNVIVNILFYKVFLLNQWG